jgi:hypothetical protein
VAAGPVMEQYDNSAAEWSEKMMIDGLFRVTGIEKSECE